MAPTLRRWLRPAGAGLGLISKELRQNRFAYLFPLPFFLPLLIRTVLLRQALPLGSKASLAVLAAAAILAVVYGLQGFAGEADRRTLDFLLAKPVSPAGLILVKFACNVLAYSAWLGLFAACLRLDPPAPAMLRGMVSAWVLLILFTLLGMAFLASLLSKGSERLLITVLLSGGAAFLCFLLWHRVLTLAAAAFFWPDIPPGIYMLVGWFLPLLMLALVLLVSPAASLWLLRCRPSLPRFRPARRLFVAWAVLCLTIEVSRAALGPPVWPLPREFMWGAGGDWHPRAGVAVAGTRTGEAVGSLAVARLGGKAHTVYRGGRVYSPRWSPDGRSIAFVDKGWIKLLQGRRVRTVARGEHPFWSRDGNSLAYAAGGGKGETVAIRRVSLRTGGTSLLWRGRMELVGFVWDSARGRLYLFGQDGVLSDIDLRSGRTARAKFPTPVKFSMQNPLGVLGPDGLLHVAVTYEHSAHVLTYAAGSAELVEVDSCAGRVRSTMQALVCPEKKGFLWPRTDMAYVYQGFPIEHEHDGEHEHEDGHED